MLATLRGKFNSFRRRSVEIESHEDDLSSVQTESIHQVDFEIAPDDPLLAYMSKASGVVDIDELSVDSTALTEMKLAGVKLVVPLVSQGELVGLLNLGPRRSEQDYTGEDRNFLNSLATQAAPALRLAFLARQQQIEALEQERLKQELRVARIIQETLLPKEIPSMQGWHLSAYWQPANAVSGDFYDFIEFPDGKLGVICADVTDKGVPAALVMATTRSLLRGAAEKLISPGKVLAQANDLLCPDIPRNMFVTCLYMLFDPQSGHLVFANAGHNLPYKNSDGEVEELRATGMPLGLMSGMDYEEVQAELCPGESLLLYSDGLVEAHNPEGDMFGFPRLRSLMADLQGGQGLIETLVDALTEFTGEDWVQEDDVTFVVIERTPVEEPGPSQDDNLNGWHTLTTFSVASEPGNERQAMQQVASAVEELKLSEANIERLKTAVAEATMNAMEHGNGYQPELTADIEVRTSPQQLSVRITDQNSDGAISLPDQPDLEAKLSGEQSPRGWGLFLIENMVDEMHIHTGDGHHTIELIVNRKGA
jgi:serine phosphatase RsbU (regulator of sigma subunit)/anti-sigma regulatory factor (Ser/Thr protein kinase)